MRLVPHSPINHEPALRVRESFARLREPQGLYDHVERVRLQAVEDARIRAAVDLEAWERDMRRGIRWALLVTGCVLLGSAIAYLVGGA
jgi:hypothetical protein